MFIFELLIYVIFALIMHALARKSALGCKKEDGLDRYLWAYILFFTFISAIRWNVGADCNSYIDIFKNGQIRDGSTEYLWDWLVIFIHDNGIHFAFGMGIVAFLQISLLTKACEKYRYILLWLPIILYGGRYFQDLMNGIRQMVVACGFVYLSRYIVDRKVISYVVGIFLLSWIHNSAVMLLPLCLLTYVPFDKIKIANKRILCLGIFLFCFTMGQTPAFQDFAIFAQEILEISGYAHFESWVTDILEGKQLETLSFGPMMISYLLLSIVIIWFAPKLKEVYEKRIQYFDVWYFCSFLFSCLYFLVCNTSHLLIRIAQYFEFFQVIMLALLLHYLYVKRKYSIVYFWVLILVIWLNTGVAIYKDYNLVKESTTYKTILFRDNI